jgi:hypothetical protein
MWFIYPRCLQELPLVYAFNYQYSKLSILFNLNLLGAYLYKFFNKSFTIMFAINASLLLLAIIYSISNLKVSEITQIKKIR